MRNKSSTKWTMSSAAADTYPRIKKGIKTAVQMMKKGGARNHEYPLITRRTFLKGSLAAAGLTIAVSVSPFGTLLNASQDRRT